MEKNVTTSVNLSFFLKHFKDGMSRKDAIFDRIYQSNILKTHLCRTHVPDVVFF